MDAIPRIGVFDSGLGGLSVWQELAHGLPSVPLVYVGDQTHCPYGPKTPAFITERAVAITQFLRSMGCQMVVVACNTATGAAIAYLRAHFPIPFVGMEPAVKPAALQTRTGVIGVLATAGTLGSALFQKTVAQYAQGVEVVTQVGEGLVELVEAGLADSETAEPLLKRYVQPMIAARADHIVLGCTHYPFLIPRLQQIVGSDVQLVNPAPAVAKQAKNIWLNLHHIAIENPHHLFFTTSETAQMQPFLEKNIYPTIEKLGVGFELGKWEG